MEYKALKQGIQDFSIFWAEFQYLVLELNYLDEVLIDNLINKYYMSIQWHLMTGKKNPIDLLQLATHCQKIEHRLKKANCNQLVQD